MLPLSFIKMSGYRSGPDKGKLLREASRRAAGIYPMKEGKDGVIIIRKVKVAIIECPRRNHNQHLRGRECSLKRTAE